MVAYIDCGVLESPASPETPKIQHCDLLSLPVGATKQDLLRANCSALTRRQSAQRTAVNTYTDWVSA
jgi:hypothetical protein